MAEEATPEKAHSGTKMAEDKPARKARSSRYASIGLGRFICTFIVVFLLLAGVTALIVWLIYRPQQPHFAVVGAALYDINMTFPSTISTTMQFTIVTRNPNRRVSIYYDQLSAFVSYRNLAITPQVMLPPLFQEKHSTVALSLVLGGGYVPVSMEVVNGLGVDQEYGLVGLRLVLLGKLRWKAGVFRSEHYGVYVGCDVLVGLKNGYVGQLPLLGSSNCNVDI